MPEEIIRSYLADPHLYAADATFCCGCGTHVPNHECVWVDTGEDLQSYMNHLRQPKAHASQSVTSTPTKPAPPLTLTNMGPGDFIVQASHAQSGREYPPFLVHAKDEAAARALCNRNYLMLVSVERYVEQPGQPKPRTFRFGPPISDRDFERDYGSRPPDKSDTSPPMMSFLLGTLGFLLCGPFGWVAGWWAGSSSERDG